MKHAKHGKRRNAIETPLDAEPVMGITFDNSNFVFSRGDHTKAWEAAIVIITNLLEEVGTIGHYHVRTYRQVRWKGNHGAVPVKVNLCENRILYLTVKTPENGNSSVFEYAIRGTFPSWDCSDLFTKIENYIADANAAEPAKEEPVTPVKPAPVAPTPPAPPAPPTKKLTVVERIAQLEAVSQRNAGRETALQALRAKKDEHTADLQRVQALITRLETEELQLMEDIENDNECREAQKALATLESLLS